MKDEFPDWNQTLSQTRLVDFPILDDQSTSNVDNPPYFMSSAPRQADKPVSVMPSSSVGKATFPMDVGHVVTSRQAVHDVISEQQTHGTLDFSYAHGATGSTQVSLKPNNPNSSNSDAVNTKSYNSQVFLNITPPKSNGAKPKAPVNGSHIARSPKRRSPGQRRNQSSSSQRNLRSQSTASQSRQDSRSTKFLRNNTLNTDNQTIVTDSNLPISQNDTG